MYDQASKGFLSFSFGGHKNGPSAFLSLKSEGDMLFPGVGSNPARDAFFGKLGIDSSRVAGISLVHSKTVAFTDEGPIPLEGDGIITRDSSLFPSVTVADCLPVWIWDRSSGAFGVLHSGWKGTGILAECVSGMRQRYGTKPSDISVIFGPRIGPCCYSVDEERARGFEIEFGSGSVVVKDGTKRLDLSKANENIAHSLGIEDITTVRLCTSCDTRFGSYRRETNGHPGSSFTRMAASIGWIDGA